MAQSAMICREATRPKPPNLNQISLKTKTAHRSLASGQLERAPLCYEVFWLGLFPTNTTIIPHNLVGFNTF